MIENETLIKLALKTCVENANKLNLGNLTTEEMGILLDQMVMKPYCERLGKKYENLTEDDREYIAELKVDEEIRESDERSAQIERDYLNGECSIDGNYN